MSERLKAVGTMTLNARQMKAVGIIKTVGPLTAGTLKAVLDDLGFPCPSKEGDPDITIRSTHATQ